MLHSKQIDVPDGRCSATDSVAEGTFMKLLKSATLFALSCFICGPAMAANFGLGSGTITCTDVSPYSNVLKYSVVLSADQKTLQVNQMSSTGSKQVDVLPCFEVCSPREGCSNGLTCQKDRNPLAYTVYVYDASMVDRSRQAGIWAHLLQLDAQGKSNGQMWTMKCKGTNP
jgi:hypothetical protein